MRAQPHLPAPAQQPRTWLCPCSAHCLTQGPALPTGCQETGPHPSRQVALLCGPTWAESRGRGRKPTPREDGGRASRPPSCTHLPGAAARLGHHPLLRVASLAQGHTASPGTRCPFLGGGGEGLRPRPPWCHLGATPPKPLSGTSLARLSLGIQLGLGLNSHNLSEPPIVSL